LTTNQPPATRPLGPQPKAIIVGASSGIGAALARRLARQGYTLALLGRRLELLQQLCDELNAQGQVRARAYRHDVLNTREVPALLQTITAELGGLDLFIYNSGIMFPSNPETYSAEQDLLVLQVNSLGAIAWLDPVAQRFARAGAGQIVGIGSIAGDRGRPGAPAYNASKAALHTYLEGLRNRVSRYGVTVTTIKPGQIATDMLKNAGRVRSPIPVDRAADLIWRAIRSHQQMAYIPARWGLISLVIRHLPSFIFRRLNL
jgi:short-subunit dehydrogenase